MGNRKKPHVYDPAMQRTLQGITLPPKIKCGRCDKYKVHENFSFKQLNDARYAIYNRGKGATYKINCRPCTGGHLVELECTTCNVTKGLEEFSKIQRAKPDTAKCYDCVEKQLETEPVNDELYENPTNAFVPLDSSGGNYPEYWSNNTSRSAVSQADGEDEWNSDGEDGGVRLNGVFSQMAVSQNRSGTLTGTLIDTDPDPFNADQGGPVRSEDDWQVAQGKSRQTRASPIKTGSTSGYSKAFGSNMTERSDAKNGWAKIKAYKPGKQPVALPDDDWKSESESDTNEADDDDDDEYTEI